MENKSWYREPYAWMVILFPVIAVVGGIITVFLAIKSDDGLVVDDYYQQGLAINRTLEREHVAEKHGLKATLEFLPAKNILRVRLDATGEFQFPDTILISFFHTTRKGFDQNIHLAKITDGVYEGMIPDLVPGNWDIEIETDNWRILDTLVFPL